MLLLLCTLLQKTLLDSTSVMYKNWCYYILLSVEEKQINFAYVSACICLSRATVLLCLGV